MNRIQTCTEAQRTVALPNECEWKRDSTFIPETTTTQPNNKP